jgi:hypothetical protein
MSNVFAPSPPGVSVPGISINRKCVRSAPSSTPPFEPALPASALSFQPETTAPPARPRRKRSKHRRENFSRLGLKPETSFEMNRETHGCQRVDAAAWATLCAKSRFRSPFASPSTQHTPPRVQFIPQNVQLVTNRKRQAQSSASPQAPSADGCDPGSLAFPGHLPLKQGAPDRSSIGALVQAIAQCELRK